MDAFLVEISCILVKSYTKTMKKFKVIKISEYWSTDSLTKNIEIKLNSLSQEGYEIISVSVGINMWWFPTAYITVSKDL